MSLIYDWKGYYKKVNGRPPRALLVEALEYVDFKGNCLDIGSGSMNDTRYLLEIGFENVVSIDPSVESKSLAEKVVHPNLEFHNAPAERFDFGNNRFDFVNAQFSLPFIPKEDFDAIWSNIYASLKIGGIFCGQLFGDRDEWNTDDDPRTFHTKERADLLAKPFEIIKWQEEEKDDFTAMGIPKHWHLFHFILRKQ